MVRHATALLLSILPAAWGCGGGGGGDAGPDTTVATVSVSPGAVLLTGAGETRVLRATAHNAAGEELAATAVVWDSSAPTLVAVDAQGTAQAVAGLGSAAVTATVDGVASAPVVVLVATPAPGAVLVDDSRVLGEPEPADPGAAFGVGWEYRLELTGTPPAVGELLVGTGEAPVAGRVTAVDISGANPVVTLQVVTADELFADLLVEEVVDLAAVAAELPTARAGDYDLAPGADGSYTLMPKRAGRVAAAGAVGTTALGPFSCKAQTTGVFPFSLTGGATDLKITPALDFTLHYDSANGGLQKLAVAGTVKAEFTASDTLTVGYSGKVVCEGEILHIRLPIAGPASLLFGGVVPLGAGFELAGEVNLAQLGFELKAVGEATFEAGLVCPGGADCTTLSTLETKGDLQPRWIAPDPSNIDAQLQLKPLLAGYGFAELAVGPAFWQAAQLSFIRVKGGLAQEADLKLVEAQLLDTAYQSDYKLSLASSVGTAPDLGTLADLFNISVAPVALTFTTLLAVSPAIAAATADVGSFAAGDPVTFTVSLDPATLTYLTVYNVTEVQIFRREQQPGGDLDAILVASQAAADGQREFTLPWTADTSGTVGEDFHAFVVTRFLPFPYFGSLELGPVSVPSALKVLAVVTGAEFLSRPEYLTRAEVTAWPAGGSAESMSAEEPTAGLPLLAIDTADCSYAGGLEILPGNTQTFDSHATFTDLADAASSLQISVASNGQEARLAFDLRAWGREAVLERGGPWVDESGTADTYGGPERGRLLLMVANEGVVPANLEVSWDYTGTLTASQPADGSAIYSQAWVTSTDIGLDDECGGSSLLGNIVGETSMSFGWEWATANPLSATETMSGMYIVALEPGLHLIEVSPTLFASASPGLDWDGPDVHEVTATVSGAMVFRAAP